MTIDAQKDTKPIRLVFELARADHPRLYDDLAQFHKGTKRVNRLRVLAYDGLLAQKGVFAGVDHAPRHRIMPNGAQEGSGEVTNDLFEPSIEE
ncbi:MAG: hypothetical protein ACD_23C01368G0004 [uncultured bacterium]|nr:MAG: hypothetical protein ACD_23C01368G0004 [uncultured bacterium]